MPVAFEIVIGSVLGEGKHLSTCPLLSSFFSLSLFLSTFFLLQSSPNLGPRAHASIELPRDWLSERLEATIS